MGNSLVSCVLTHSVYQTAADLSPLADELIDQTVRKSLVSDDLFKWLARV